MTEQRELWGTLARNEKRESECQPTHKGECKIEGTDYIILAWVEEGKSGELFSLGFVPIDTKASKADINAPLDNEWRTEGGHPMSEEEQDIYTFSLAPDHERLGIPKDADAATIHAGYAKAVSALAAKPVVDGQKFEQLAVSRDRMLRGPVDLFSDDCVLIRVIQRS
jgi:hypothetical protein